MNTTGLKSYRLRADNPREIAFAEEWFKVNNRDTNAPLLQYLVDNPSERDQVVAATIIQWLGSNVGTSFIGKVIENSPELQQTLSYYFKDNEKEKA